MPITSGWVAPTLLYAQVFDNRQTYSPVIKALRKAGLEDPFIITPGIRAHVESLFRNFKPPTQLDKAVLLLQSVIPADAVFAIGPTYYDGLSICEGGLEIARDKGLDCRLRKKYGSILPDKLVQSPKKERFAICLEYSMLLVALLRAAGIKASVKSGDDWIRVYDFRNRTGEADHAYVIAELDGEKYKLDAGLLIFEKTTDDEDIRSCDLESTAFHYINKSSFLSDEEAESGMAIEFARFALELAPNLAEAWNNMGAILKKAGELGEALSAFNKAVQIKHNYPKAWRNLGETLQALGRTEEATQAREMADKLAMQKIVWWF